MRVGKNNLMQQALSAYDVKMDEMAINLVNDSTIYMDGHVYGIESGTLVLDTVTLYATQKDKYISYNLHVGNRPGTNDEFAQVSLRGGIRGNAVGGLLEQQNIQGVQGFRFGVNAFLSDTVVNMKVFPKNLIIGYRNWTVNDSNIVAFNNIEREFEADLNLKSDSSFVSLKTTPNKEQKGQDDVLLSIGGVQISEWLKVSPYIPPMSGLLSADMKMKFDGKNILGGGISRLKGFKYNRKAVGDFAFKLGLELDPVKNYIRLASAFDVDGRKTIVARGSLNDTTSVYPYNITLTVDSLPLKVANPFIPGDMANLSGALNGSMNLVGSFTEPIINGYVQCAGAEINMPLFGSHLTLSDTKIPVDYSLITFDGFKVYGSNKNAINVDGYVDLLPLDNPKIDVSLKGNNVEFVNSKQRRKMEVFGKGYANLDATALGTMNDLSMNVDLTLLPTTNLTYVLQTDVSAISTQTDENMVKFISFADTAHSETDTLATPIVTSNFRLNTKLNIQQGSKFNVYLSNNGRDRVEIEGSGLLNYSQSSLGDMRLVGNYTLSEGFVRYTPPLLSEKLFEFTDGSYISWTGDVLNPTLNIKAVDEMKASVSQEGQDSRLVNFLVSLSVTNALNNMNLEFDLSTNDDVTVGFNAATGFTNDNNTMYLAEYGDAGVSYVDELSSVNYKMTNSIIYTYAPDENGNDLYEALHLNVAVQPDVNSAQNLNAVVLFIQNGQYLRNADGSYLYALLQGQMHHHDVNDPIVKEATYVLPWYGLNNGVYVGKTADMPYSYSGESPVAANLDNSNLYGVKFYDMQDLLVADLTEKPLYVMIFVISNLVTDVESLINTSEAATNAMYVHVHGISKTTIPTAIEGVTAEDDMIIVGIDGGAQFIGNEPRVDVYNTMGMLVETFSLNGVRNVELPAGVYIANGKKFVVR